MQHLEQKAQADGITVPLIGNDNGTWNSGPAALAVDGVDSYPQGFNCSQPDAVGGVPDISFDHPAGQPIFSRSSRAARSTRGAAPDTTSARS